MCKISKEAVLRANRSVSCSTPIQRSSDGTIVVSTRYAGTTYSQSISMDTIRSNYGKALKKFQ